MGGPSRRRVTYGQLELLWEFLNRQRALALGYNKTAQARELSRRMWEEVAQNLNSHADGAVKDWKGWGKYWNDYKSKLKKLSHSARESYNATGGGPSTGKPLCDVENKFLTLLGKDYGSGMPGKRVEPFPTVEETCHSQESGSESILTGIDISSLPILCNVPEPEPAEQATVPHCSPRHLCPSSPNPHPPTPTERQVTPRRSPRLSLLSTPSMSPVSRNLEPLLSSQPCPQSLNPPPTRTTERRRRFWRQHLSAEEARRALIEETKKRTAVEEQKLDMFRMLVNECREFKQLFSQR